ncbi:sigma-70 family RNA polymerase sigma factor [Chitinophaga sp. SYP-B3965]|uniref:RNA polymerase sigma factor n=1 Tax=Chitinophaga sp. SYP-B3965 TaxID=2663120 RepID=UPI001299D3CE|nr:sigma-70 family RNA polymerase sigma factor [Chitinophaga sp. SYP-B3965]MRG47680.1 sigma-70 family RNA polymerase sigma factor [Chitinophaga sp. SYP-B3965]
MDDSLILQRLRQGDKSAFKDLFDKYFDALLITALQYCKEPNDAQDIVQEVFVAFWENNQFDKMINDAALRGYLFKTLRNKCLDKLDAQKRLQHNLDAYAYCQREDTEEFTLEAPGPMWHDLAKGLKMLPPQTLKVVQMVYFNQKKQKEAAYELDLSPNTIRNQLVRAMRLLRKNLEAGK